MKKLTAISKDKAKRDSRRIIYRVFLYAFLISLGFIYMYPVINMTLSSFMSNNDLINPASRFIPEKLYLENYKQAWEIMDMRNSLFTSAWFSIVLSLCQTFSGAIIGYGFARFKFYGWKVCFGLVLLTIVVTPAITMIPKYTMFEGMQLIGSPLTMILPAATGQGLNAGMFILIFFQFFSMIPKSLDEASEIDGAGKLRTFLSIAIPISTPAIVVSLIFSVVWNWNETYITTLFVGKAIQTLPMRLSQFVTRFYEINPMQWGSTVNRINEGIRLAGTLVTILPLVVFYLILQKQFVESVDRAGITGE